MENFEEILRKDLSASTPLDGSNYAVEAYGLAHDEDELKR